MHVPLFPDSDVVKITDGYTSFAFRLKIVSLNNSILYLLLR